MKNKLLKIIGYYGIKNQIKKVKKKKNFIKFKFH